MLICLQCVFIGCGAPGTTGERHFASHRATTDHYLAVDTTLLQVYCATCDSYIYDVDCDRIVREERAKALFRAAEASDPDDRRAAYERWQASEEDGQLLARESRPVPLQKFAGLRGMNNLGNTCFMSCILQSFVHNPPLRNYFLARMHAPEECEAMRNGDLCLACEFNRLFAETFSGERSAITPHRVLHTVWNAAKLLAGYEQQDAHEFMISVLDVLHTHCRGTGDRCQCIVHTVFSGTLRSEVTCLTCGNTSATFEAHTDLSLDLPPPADPIVTADGTELQPPRSLIDCLDRFTREEQMGTESKVDCSRCGVKRESTKQLTMEALPMVMCFHLKRFKHAHSKGGSRPTKLDTPVMFPIVLDMSKYLSSSASRSAQLLGPPPDQPPQLYELFSVVNHHGRMDQGHYTNFVRHIEPSGDGSDGGVVDAWYKCDDSYVRPAPLADVLTSEGYLLFYVRKHIDYEKVQPPDNGEEINFLDA